MKMRQVHCVNPWSVIVCEKASKDVETPAMYIYFKPYVQPEMPIKLKIDIPCALEWYWF